MAKTYRLKTEAVKAIEKLRKTLAPPLELSATAVVEMLALQAVAEPKKRGAK